MSKTRIEWIKDSPDYQVSADRIDITIPIVRSFESEGKKYIHGYATIFDSADAFGTIISKELVESSLPSLYKYPSLRFMHRTPLGQIVFDRRVNGIGTTVDEHGFHILARIFDQCEKEWQMIRNGKWGFSYGMLPDKDGIGRKCDVDGKCYEVFLKGRLYEVSVVDTPAHPEAQVHVINRSTNNRKRTLIGYDVYEITENEQLRVPDPKQPTQIPDPTPIERILALKMLDPQERYVDPIIEGKNVPIICDPNQCEIKMCPDRFNEARHGKLCRYHIPPNPEANTLAKVPQQLGYVNPEFKESLRL